MLGVGQITQCPSAQNVDHDRIAISWPMVSSQVQITKINGSKLSMTCDHCRITCPPTKQKWSHFSRALPLTCTFKVLKMIVNTFSQYFLPCDKKEKSHGLCYYMYKVSSINTIQCTYIKP